MRAETPNLKRCSLALRMIRTDCVATVKKANAISPTPTALVTGFGCCRVHGCLAHEMRLCGAEVLAVGLFSDSDKV
jgi:hypothetical protein